MDSTIRDEWVAALRSEEYTQGTGYLRTGNEYCCLGVLCDLAVKHDVIPAPVRSSDRESGIHTSTEFYIYGPDDDTSYVSLPKAVAEWAELDERNPEVEIPDAVFPDETHSAELAELNDDTHSFVEIADLIEDQL